MSLSAGDRTTLAALADVLIPAGGGFPSASAAGVAGEGLDLVLAARPDLAEPLARILGTARGRPAAVVVAELRASSPEAFGVLAEVVPGAYFMNAGVRQELGYAGQDARPLDPERDAVDRSLLEPVLRRGPIYRPTPGR
jgi:hypothetical protein